MKKVSPPQREGRRIETGHPSDPPVSKAPPLDPSQRTAQATEARRRRGKDTRRRLLEAAIAILQTEGWKALSTVRIAAEVGIAQSGFYRYFPDLDTCVEAALRDLCAGMREDVAQRRRAILQAAPMGGLDFFASHQRQNLELARSHGALLELLVKRRFDASVAQKPLADLVNGWREDLAVDMTGTATAMGVSISPEAVRIVAEIIIGCSLAVNEALLEGRISTDEQMETAARALAAIGEAGFMSLVTPRNPTKK